MHDEAGSAQEDGLRPGGIRNAVDRPDAPVRWRVHYVASPTSKRHRNVNGRIRCRHDACRDRPLLTEPNDSAAESTSPTNPSLLDGRADVHRATEELVAQRIGEVRRDEIITTYQDLIDSIWRRLESTLGQVTVAILMDRALTETIDRYPLLDVLAVGRSGLNLAVLEQKISLFGESEDEARLAAARQSLRELVVRLVDLLAVLTGDTVVHSMLEDLGGTSLGSSDVSDSRPASTPGDGSGTGTSGPESDDAGGGG